jgi:hypothetical protein
MPFQPGRVLVHRHFQRDRLAWVRVARVVSDDERGLLLWICSGSPLYSRRTVDGRGLRAMPFAEWITQPTRLDAGSWDGPGILKLVPPGAAHSVWWFWGEDGAFAGWYVNLEEPSVRWDDGTVAGVDMTDQDLDIWVPPDRRWQWKDEGEFVERLGFPEHYWVRDGAAVRAEGLRVIETIEAGAFPFDGTWCDYRPADPAWLTPPALPAGWDRPRSRT